MKKTNEILIVDDEIPNLKLLVELLSVEGYRVRPADSSQLAIDSALAQPPDLILLDVKMPEMDGFEVCRQLKQDPGTREIPIIFVSALQESRDKVRGFEAGGVDFLSKPFQKEEILARIRTQMALREMQLHLEQLVDERTAKLQAELTRRRQAEKSLRDSEEKFRYLVEQAPLSIQIMNTDGRITQVNKAFTKLWGLNEEDLQKVLEGYNMLEDEEAVRQGVMPLIEKAFRGESVILPVLEYDANSTLANIGLENISSNKRWIQPYLYPTKNSNGEVVSVVSLGDDITDSKLAELKAQEHEKKFYDLVEQSPVAFELYDLNGTLQQVNRAFEKLWQVPRENVVGKYNVFESDQIRELGFLEYFEKAYGGEDVSAPDVEFDASREVEAWGRGGQKRWVSTKLYPVKSTSDQITHVALMHEDIDEQKNAHDKILAYQGRLRSLASELTLTEEKERRHLAAELHDHIGQTLAFTRIKVAQAQKNAHGGKLTGLLEEISQSLLQTIQDMKELVFDLSSPLLHEIGLQAAIRQWLENHIAKKYGLGYELVSDRTKFNLSKDARFLMFRNVRELLNNVIRHAKASKVIVHLVEGEQALTIVVWDDGVGFDEEELVSNQYEKQKFGLFSIRERMEDMGGTMEIITGPGKGCKVLLSLPVDENSEQGNV